jgi:hypothetical protein
MPLICVFAATAAVWAVTQLRERRAGTRYRPA